MSLCITVILIVLTVPAVSAPASAPAMRGPVQPDTADTTYSYVASVEPVIDGYLCDDEWFDAFRTVLDTNSRLPTCSFFKQDPYFWYAAFSMPRCSTRRVNDQVGLYVDEDNDGRFAPDGSEGNYWLLVNGSGLDEVIFRSFPYPGGDSPVLGAACVSSTLHGHLVFEARLPIGTRRRYQMAVNPMADTIGLFMYTLAGVGFCGWWPIGMPESVAFNPAWYGKVVFCRRASSAVESADPQTRTRFLLEPSVVTSGRARLTLPQELSGRYLTITVVNAAGQEVRRLPVDCAAGRDVWLDLRSLTSGVYVVRVDVAALRLVIR